MKRRTALTSLLGGALAASPIATQATPEPSPTPTTEKTYTRDQVTGIIRNNQRIVTKSGVEDLPSVEINGIKQCLSIRGSNSAHPILLFLHGGPGSPTMPAAWTFQRPWEDFFTVVQWDQRGTGKTYAANGPAKLAGTMNLDQFVSDAEGVIDYLLHRFNQRKLFVLGHSWGSMVGMTLAKRRPELLHAYIGCGQVINSYESEAAGWQFALDSARAENNTAAVRELQTLAPYPGPIGSLTIERIGLQRKWLMYYGGLTHGRRDFAYDADAWQLSPAYSQRDVKLTDDGSLYSLTHLLGAVERANFDDITRLDCPVVFNLGRYDYAVSQNVAARWFERVQAPRKALTWYENSAHMMMIEEPGLFLHHLVSGVLPLTR